MAFLTWLRALNAVGAVADASGFFRAATARSGSDPAAPDTAEELETRVTTVVVAALKEAFDRDRARFDLEHELREVERTRAERAFRLEWVRRTCEQTLTHVRLAAVLSLGVWVASAGLVVWLAPLVSAAKVLLGLGWLVLFAAVGASFVAHRQMTAYLVGAPVASGPVGDPPVVPAQALLPWLLVAGCILTAWSIVLAL